VAKMSREWILKTLIELGFSEEEAEIYFLLSRDGPKKAKEIADKLKIRK
jgi:sugar-specific transcriptional regulator TrmB